MADSGITKKALAGALKKLMEEMPFSKISVGDICERCDMNRKSFYYHFKDKYDLVNWVFDTEFMEFLGETSELEGWDFFVKLHEYLYAHHDFYRRALKIDGQNAFREHFRVILEKLVSSALARLGNTEAADPFQTQFITDGFVCALERWIMEQDCVPPDQFSEQVVSALRTMAIQIYTKLEIENKQ